MQKTCPTAFLVTCLLAGFSPDGSAQSFDNKRISTENFPGDQAIGITHILDPELSRAIGARGCRIWVQPNALEQADYYLRVSSHPNALGNNFDPALFQNDTLDAAVDVLIDEAMLLPGWGYVPGSQWFPRERVRERAQRLSDFDWDYFYERVVSCDVIGSTPGIFAPIPTRWFCRNEFDRYHGPNANRLREHLLEQRGIEARFINSVDNIRIREYTMKSKESPNGVASAFVFDSDPLGYQYRREEKNRVAHRNLQNINSSSTVAYQWVRVTGNQVEYGDKHLAELPRPLNIVICGDSYTSGEGAPLDHYNLPYWIQEYAGRWSHRSVNSGWELALRELVSEKFQNLAFNIHNVSWSGAEVDETIMDAPSPDPENLQRREDSVDLSLMEPTFLTLVNDLKTGRRQLYALDDLLKKNGHFSHDALGRVRRSPGSTTADIMGFTFGGNDLGFSSLIKKILLEDASNGDWRLNPPEGNPNASSFRFDARVAKAESRVERMGSWLGQASNFGFKVNKFIIGNYPNPISNGGYLVNPFTGTRYGIDGTELGWIHNKIMPDIRQMVENGVQNVGGTLADTFTIPHRQHTIYTPFAWFNGIASIDEDTHEYQYSFHPNRAGYYNLYRPLYKQALDDCLGSGILESTFVEEAKQWDLELGTLTSLVYDHPTSTLRIHVVVQNLSFENASPASTIELFARFGGADYGSFAESFSTPLADIEGTTIIIPQLLPSEIHDFQIELRKGPESCVYHDLMLSHFLALQDQGAVQNIIGEVYDSDTLAARLAAWPALFGEDLRYHFEVKPVSGLEDRVQNNASQEGIIEAELQDLIAWIHKNHKLLHDELASRAANFDVHSLGELSELLLDERPELMEIFGLGSSAGFDRSSIPQAMEEKALQSLGIQIRNRARLGVLAPELSHLGKEVAGDRLTLRLPSGAITISAARFQEVSKYLPFDGTPISAVYHQALPPETELKEPYQDHPTTVVAPHYFTGLASYSAEDPSISNNTVKIDLRFAQEDEVARWSLKDPISKVTFMRGLMKKGSEPIHLNVEDLIFHSSASKVRVASFQEEGTELLDYFSYNPDPGATIQQEYEDQLGSEIQIKLTITGERASDLAEGFDVLIYSDSVSSLIYETSPSKLNTAMDETTPYIDFLLGIPLDFVDSSMRLMRLTSKSDPNTVLTTSLHLSALRPYLPSTLQANHSGVETEVLSDKEVVVRSSNAGLLMVDTTEDFKVWRRALTTMFDGDAPYKFAMPPSSSNKLFLRARMMKAQ